MGWLGRIGDLLSPSGRKASGEPDDGPEDEAASGPVERKAPGLAALFASVDPEESHAVLDLGPAAGASLEIYGRYAGGIRFADLLATRDERGLRGALGAVPARPEQPYDLVFAWNTLDRLSPRGRGLLVDRLVELTAPDARLHAIFDTSGEPARRVPTRFSVLDVDRMRYEPDPSAPAVQGGLLPAEVEELLAPFRVAKGFTLAGGLREYVAVREDG